MRTFLAVCLLVVGGWVVTVADTSIFLNIWGSFRSLSFMVYAAAALLFVGLGLLCLRSRRPYYLGVTLLVAALAVWATLAGYLAVSTHERLSRILPTDFSDSMGDVSFGFGWLLFQTLLSIWLIWKYRAAKQ